MTNIQARHDSALLQVSVDTLIDQHGRWRVALTAIAAACRSKNQRRRVQGVHVLDNHLRADIGLEPLIEPPGMDWRLRR